MDEFGGQGLSIIGVTGEGQKPTEKWVADKGVRYPYAYEKGSDLQRAVGLRGYPHAALIDPSGTIVWTGHPARLDRATIETALAGALVRPLFDWPRSMGTPKREFKKGNLGKALLAAKKLADKGESAGRWVTDSIQSFIEFKVERAAALAAEGNYLELDDSGPEILRQVKGLAEYEERMESLLDQLDTKEAKHCIKGQLKLRKHIEEFWEIKNPTQKDVLKWLKKLDKLRDDFAGTYVEEDAREFLLHLQALSKLKK